LEKKNRYVEYYEEYGRWSQNRLINLESAIQNLQYISKKAPNFIIQDRRIHVPDLDIFTPNEYFDIV
jgi:hypothetical protein